MYNYILCLPLHNIILLYYFIYYSKYYVYASIEVTVGSLFNFVLYLTLRAVFCENLAGPGERSLTLTLVSVHLP